MCSFEVTWTFNIGSFKLKDDTNLEDAADDYGDGGGGHENLNIFVNDLF